MARKSDIEISRAALLKAVRSTIRLKYSLLADRELNDTLPEVEKDFDKAIANGEAYELITSDILLSIEDDHENNYPS